MDIKENKIYFNNIFKNFGKKKDINDNTINKSLPINKKNKIQMNKIKKNVYKLKEEIFKMEDDVEKTINEINKFLIENADKSRRQTRTKSRSVKKLKNSEVKKTPNNIKIDALS